MYKYFPIILLLTGCSEINIKAGASYFDENRYINDKKLNPLGVIRVDYETERGNEIFCEHVSSIPYQGDGDELNHCGFLFKL